MFCKPDHISTGSTKPLRAGTSTCGNTLKKFVMFKNKIIQTGFFFFSVLIATVLLLDVVYVLPLPSPFLLAPFYLKHSSKW